MNLPEISHQRFKKQEVEIGSVLETYAQESADNALLKEKEIPEQKKEILQKL